MCKAVESLFSNQNPSDLAPSPPIQPDTKPVPEIETEPAPLELAAEEDVSMQPNADTQLLPIPKSEATPILGAPSVQDDSSPADALFEAVRNAVQRVLKAPMRDTEVAAALNVSNGQAKAWLQRLVDEGVVEKQKKPAGYILKQNRLFE